MRSLSLWQWIVELPLTTSHHDRPIDRGLTPNCERRRLR